MDIKWKCDGCGQPAVTDSQYAGAEVECPNCKKSLTIPNIEPSQKSEKSKLEPETKCRIHDHKDASFTCAKCGQPACEMCLVAVGNYSYCQSCFTGQKAMKKGKAPEPKPQAKNVDGVFPKTEGSEDTSTKIQFFAFEKQLPPNFKGWLIEYAPDDLRTFASIKEIRKLLLDGTLTRHHRACLIEPQPRIEDAQQWFRKDDPNHDQLVQQEFEARMDAWHMLKILRPIGYGLAEIEPEIRSLYDPVSAFASRVAKFAGSIPFVLLLVFFFVLYAWNPRTADSTLGGPTAESVLDMFARALVSIPGEDIYGRMSNAKIKLVVGDAALVVTLIASFLLGICAWLIGKLAGWICYRRLLHPPDDQWEHTAKQCPHCGASGEHSTVVCIKCGYHFGLRRCLEIDAPATTKTKDEITFSSLKSSSILYRAISRWATKGPGVCLILYLFLLINFWPGILLSEFANLIPKPVARNWEEAAERISSLAMRTEVFWTILAVGVASGVLGGLVGWHVGWKGIRMQRMLRSP